ncbi:FAR1-related protein [Trifolium pratense]|uniref:FAR1-related protein n=1 Tax=Trifolium pratense TaxID=57577 RepID=A0A2K3LZK0_TRIPR|nr:FAR1-related protein [Trifolium pratense]
MYEYDDEAIFEKAWTDLINEYKVHDRNWIKSAYALKKKWASCYMKEAFTLGMRSTQVSESLNAHFKSCMKPNLDITQFFKHFEQVVEEKRGKELTCEYESSHKLASCKKFDTFGILCSHALKVFEANDVKVVPEKYILTRWTREARYGIVKDSRGNEVEGDPKLSRTRMFRQVVSKFIRAAADASSSEECLEIVDNTVEVMCTKIIEFRLQARDNECHINDNPAFVSSDVMQPNGFKTRPSRKGPQRRPKSWVECQSKRGKRGQTQRAPYKGPQNQVYEARELPTQLLDGVSCSAPPTYAAPQTQDGQFSFTTYLMAPLNDTDIGDIGVNLL